jgi:hypothetical protein
VNISTAPASLLREQNFGKFVIISAKIIYLCAISVNLAKVKT